VTANIAALAYLFASVCFIMALRGLSSPESARAGNFWGITGMVVAIATTLLSPEVLSYTVIAVGVLIGGALGTVIALRIQMTALPQLVAAFHSLVGLAAVLVAAAALYNPEAYGIGISGQLGVASLLEMSIGTAIGAVTFSGSIIAFGKLQGLVSGKPLTFTGQHLLNALLAILMVVLVVWFCRTENLGAFWMIALLALVLGVLLIVPIGGADMLLIIVGALVGSSGAILSYVMCKGMNRSIINVLLGGFGGDSAAAAAVGDTGDRSVKSGSAEDAAFIMKNARKVIIVPGYGMAVAQAQHALREMGDVLKAEGVEVKYAIHPVAGRMPGHMNVLLAEANVSYDEVFELEEINHEFSTADVVYVIGANDVTNPVAKADPASPIYGMPILDVEKSQTVLFVKRSMAAGYAGVDNELFFRDNTMMLFGDAKKMTEEIVQAMG
jgi:NAD(P) transhydrogenase subunit beta